MDPEFVNLTPENLADEHLSCIIRVRKPHPGVEAKRQWLADRLREGHVFRKLQVKDPVFIEYAPLETAWVPVLGDNYLYVYCLWAYGAGKGKGYGRALMEYCLADARVQGKSGVCLLGAKKQKAWLTDQAFARKFGFEVVDATDDGYELLALSFDGTVPRFAPHAKAQAIDSDELTIYYDFQCPYVPERIEAIRRYCEANDVPLTLIQVDSLQKAKELPGVFNNWGVFYKGKFETVNVLDTTYLKRILKKWERCRRDNSRCPAHHPVRSLSEGRAFQAMARPGWRRAHRGNRRSRTGNRSRVRAGAQHACRCAERRRGPGGGDVQQHRPERCQHPGAALAPSPSDIPSPLST